MAGRNKRAKRSGSQNMGGGAGSAVSEIKPMATALPAAGQSSSPLNQEKPLSMQEIRQAVFDQFGVSSAAELSKNASFQMASSSFDFKRNDPESWKQAYRKFVGVIPQEKFGNNLINGIDVKKYNRSLDIFGVDPKKFEKVEYTTDKRGRRRKKETFDQEGFNAAVNKSFRGLANRHHPDKGGDPEIYQRLQLMRDSLIGR